MTKINNYIVEIQKPVEIVYELENKEVMMPEEKVRINNKSKLSSAARNKVIKKHGSDYLSERTFNHDIALTQMYGPGFWDDIKGVVKPISSVVLVAASVFPPTAPIAVPIVLTVGAAGAVAMGAGHLADNENLKEVGKDLVQISYDSIEGQGGPVELANRVKK